MKRYKKNQEDSRCTSRPQILPSPSRSTPLRVRVGYPIMIRVRGRPRNATELRQICCRFAVAECRRSPATDSDRAASKSEAGPGAELLRKALVIRVTPRPRQPESRVTVRVTPSTHSCMRPRLGFMCLASRIPQAAWLGTPRRARACVRADAPRLPADSAQIPTRIPKPRRRRAEQFARIRRFAAGPAARGSDEERWRRGGAAPRCRPAGPRRDGRPCSESVAAALRAPALLRRCLPPGFAAWPGLADSGPAVMMVVCAVYLVTLTPPPPPSLS